MKYIIKSLLALGVVVISSILYLSYSIHSNYYQGVRAAESYKHAKTVTASLSKHYSINLKHPNHIAELNLEKTEENYIGKIVFDNQTGVVKIQLAGESLSEGALIFSPQIKNSNDLSYTCHALNVPPEHIPKNCAMSQNITSPSP
ncbi:hypothetical protein [Pseudomonas zhanjiangensis]|uniref:Pilin n=1 Tax=Pseudomonas zhanjiangensis TaxID=3239015 RepID=A0ABV3YWB0_9PSED